MARNDIHWHNPHLCVYRASNIMMTSSNGNIFPRYWPFVRGIHRSPVNSPHKGQWRGALMFSLICVWIIGWVNNREAGDMRRYRANYDVIAMILEMHIYANFIAHLGHLTVWYVWQALCLVSRQDEIIGSFPMTRARWYIYMSSPFNIR